MISPHLSLSLAHTGGAGNLIHVHDSLVGVYVILIFQLVHDLANLQQIRMDHLQAVSAITSREMSTSLN